MRITMKIILNAVCLRRPAVFFVSLAMFVVMGPALWAAGKSDKIESVSAEGGEVWEHDFDVTHRRKGLYNYIVYARDRAGNEAISGPFNVHIDPHAGLPTTRVIYPAADAIIRQSINLLGVASGRYGIERVMVCLDSGEFTEVTGTEYWNQYIDFSDIPDGKHTLHVQAIDSLGAAGPVESVHFILDTTPPQIDITSHQIGDIVTGSITLRGTAKDPNGIQTMEYSEDGENFILVPGRKRGHTDFDFSLSINTKKMEDGPLMYYFRAVDTTGIATVRPCLLFVTNSGPELELYSPDQGVDIYGTFLLSGRAYDNIGLSQVYYEWGKIKENIEMRPGDPYWNVKLEFVKGSANSIKVSAIDKVGNVTSITRKLEDKRKIKVPVLVIDYPSEEALKAMQKGMPADTAIYGHIAPGSDPRAVMLDGFGEVEALSGFRIAPHMIPYGRGAQTLKITPFDSAAVKGTTTSVRYVKQESLAGDISEVAITAPAKNGWYSGRSLSLQGTVARPQNVELQFRLNPQDSWQPVRMDLEGVFSQEISMDGRPQGPVHMELRTVQRGEAHYPMYHPFNWAASQPEITFLSPTEEHSLIWGSKTVMGAIEHTVPIAAVAYTLDRRNFEDIPFVSYMGKTWFSYFCDFNTLLERHGQLAFRVTDAGGAVFYEMPQYTVEPNPPIPTIILNSPVDDEVITDAFDISGLAYDEVGIAAVYWRILGPKMESLSTGPAGEEARRLAALYEANPDVPFEELLTDQNFSIPINFSMITDGEYIVEIYAANPYGVHSETIARTIKISTEPPETRIIAPSITRYNRKAIMVRGFSSDANGVESVTLSMDNGNTWQNVILHTDGRWELTLNTANYTDGIYSALINTRDNYGITSLSNAMVNIDNTDPELYLTSPVDGQHVGTNIRLMGRVSDMTLKTLTFQIISAENPEFRRTLEADPKLVIFETFSLAGFPQGEYILRVVAKDLADNETLISRKIVYDADDNAAEIGIYNPLPGEIHAGPINIVGIVTGTFLPEEVQLMMNDKTLERVPVNRYGIFRYEIPEVLLSGEGAYKISAFYYSETNTMISSPNHTVYYSPYGPILQVESHQDGVVITGRPWLEGQAWYNIPELDEDAEPFTRRERIQQRAEYSVENILVSHDNGRTFQLANGTDEWKFRLETSLLPRGPQPVVVKAEFANGAEAVRRLLVYVDTTIPQVETISPSEDSVHRENILIYGTAGDNYELDNVEVALRPYDKFFYSVPGAIQGLYFDIKGFGATYFDVGLGLSLFDDNVRLQGQFGITPADGAYINNLVEGGRYVGYAVGVKLLANIFYLPFDYLFGLDWAFYSMNFAVGANFSYFFMDQYRSPLFMGAVLAQWDIANINMQFIYPNWKYFRNFALYVEPELWFASTDIDYDVRPDKTIPVNKTIFRMTVGIRINWF